MRPSRRRIRDSPAKRTSRTPSRAEEPGIKPCLLIAKNLVERRAAPGGGEAARGESGCQMHDFFMKIRDHLLAMRVPDRNCPDARTDHARDGLVEVCLQGS